MAIWAEIRRRKVFQVVAAYAVVAWLLIQVVTSIEGPLNLPDWVDTTVIVFLALGLPVAIVLAWVFDITPQGIEVSPPAAAPAQTASPAQGNRFVQVTQVLVLLAIAFLIVDQYWLDDSTVTEAAAVQLTANTLPVTRFVNPAVPGAPLASTSGYDVAISRDGRRLAWVAVEPESNGNALYVRDLDEFEARRIVGSDVLHGLSGDNYNPFFSPDGNEVAFFLPGTGLLRAGIDGGEPRLVTRNIGVNIGGTWGTDGTIIYSNSGTLYRVAAGGGNEAETLLGAAAVDGNYVAPHLLPDGRSLLASIIDGQNTEYLIVIDLETLEQRTVLEGGMQNPRYTESGHIAFARGNELLAAPFDIDELAVTGEPQLIARDIRWASGNAADFTLSLSGTLAYVSGNSTGNPTANELLWVARDGTVLGPAIDGPIQPAIRDLRLSPDGRRLAASRGDLQGFEGANALWIYDLNGRPPIPLTFGGGLNLMPAWSPDGRDVVFLSNLRQPGTFELYRVPSDGSARLLEPFLTGFVGGPMDWPSNDELIVVQQREASGADIRVMQPVAAAAVRDLVVTDFNDYDATLSPDGRRLAFVSDRTGSPEIWVMTWPDGVAVRVSANGGFEPRWSRDDSKLFYVEGESIMSVAFDTASELDFGSPERLFTGNFSFSPSAFLRSFDVAPDGRFLMLRDAVATETSRFIGNDSIFVIQNWSNELGTRAR